MTPISEFNCRDLTGCAVQRKEVSKRSRRYWQASPALHGESNQPAESEDPGPTELSSKVIRLEIRQVVARHGLALGGIHGDG